MKNNTPKLAVFIIAAIVIAAMMPHGNKLLTDFKTGERWNHATLYAPFDLPIYKTDSEIAEERKAINNNFIPVYSYDNQAVSNIKKQLLDEFNLTSEQLNTLDMPVTLAHQGEISKDQAVGILLGKALKSVYDKGVASNLDKVTTHSKVDNTPLLRVEKNSILTKMSASEVYTVETATDYVNDMLAKLPTDIYPSQRGKIDLSSYIIPNLDYNKDLNIKLKERQLAELSQTKGIINQNEVIVSANQLIDKEIYTKLNSLKIAMEKQIGDVGGWMTRLGYFIIVCTLLLMSYVFLVVFRYEFSDKLKNILFLLILYVIMVGLCATIKDVEWINIYIIPLTIVPIYVMTFFDVRMSIFEFVISLLLCSLVVAKPFEFIIVNFIAGVVGVFVLRNYYRRKRIFIATGATLLAYVVSYMAMQLIQEGTLSDMNWSVLIWFGVNAILFLGLYQSIYIIEKTFGFVSDITLLELCDTNQKLLLELSHKAPGTFQHSLQVANLAEAAAKEIGANPLLARTGALYHDIGKMNSAGYFIENQAGEYNPHNDLSPKESAVVIRDHVTEGMALARKSGIPSVITEFIETHHGDSLIYYFYSQQKTIDPEGVNMDEFRYPGPRPRGKEATICMICDSVEAASRSLSEYTTENVSALVDKITDIQMNEKQYSDSSLSLHEISIVKELLKAKLSNIYHTRIAYPERK